MQSWNYIQALLLCNNYYSQARDSPIEHTDYLSLILEYEILLRRLLSLHQQCRLFSEDRFPLSEEE
jgi:hypothetical protein